MSKIEQQIKKLQKADPLFKQKQKIIDNIFSKYRKLVYVDPNTFQGLVNNKDSKIVDHEYVEEQLESSDSYFIHTNHVKAPHYAGQYIEFDKNTAIMIKHLEWVFLDKLFAGITQAPYNKRLGILQIEEARLKFNIDDDPAKICNLLFGSAQYVKRKRQWDEILEKVLDDNEDGDPENAMKLKVFRINGRISQKLGYRDLIKFEDKTLFVNPDYYYLFKTTPNRTE